MGLGSPLQDIALVEPAGVPGGDGDGDEESAAAAAPPQANGVGNGTVSGPDVDGSGKAGRDPSWPQLTVATKQRPAGVATPAVAAGGGAVPQQCVLLRAGGIMSTLDMQEGTEVLLSDAVERFWLPVSAAAAAPGRVSSSASLPLASAGGSAAATPATLSASNSTAALARQSSGAEAPPGAAAAAVAELATRQQEQQQQQQPPRVEMPWWTYGARGMQVPPRRTTLVAFAFDLANTQTARTHPTYPRLPPPQLWFPSSPLEPLTPSLRAAGGLAAASPTATGLAAAAAAASINSTDPELEFDREVYPAGVSLAEVSIIGGQAGGRAGWWMGGWVLGMMGDRECSVSAARLFAYMCMPAPCLRSRPAGVTQRTARNPAFPPYAPQALCFQPLPESQPVLPCLLRRLLQKGREEDALELAR